MAVKKKRISARTFRTRASAKRAIPFRLQSQSSTSSIVNNRTRRSDSRELDPLPVWLNKTNLVSVVTSLSASRSNSFRACQGNLLPRTTTVPSNNITRHRKETDTEAISTANKRRRMLKVLQLSRRVKRRPPNNKCRATIIGSLMERLKDLVAHLPAKLNSLPVQASAEVWVARK